MNFRLSLRVVAPALFLLLLSIIQSLEARPMRYPRDVGSVQEDAVASQDDDQGRKDRSLSFFDNFINMAAGIGGGGGGGSSYEGYQNEADLDLYEDAISRNSPRRKIQSSSGYGGNQQFGGTPYSNSPVYYIRMPPSPYVFVPGLGYVSPPPSMTNTPLMPPSPHPQSPFVNLPLEFISNAKPTGVYWGNKKPRPSKPSKAPTSASGSSKPSSNKTPVASKPQYAWPQPSIKPASQYDSPVTNLQGQYTFNGRPSGLYVLKSPFNSFYSDVLQSFYP